jgi:hypothetical protein
MAAPKKLTPAVVEAICAAIAEGKPRTVACAEQGVSDRALRAARETDPELDERIEVAEAQGASVYIERIQTAPAGKDATDDWKRWAWLGERLHPRLLSPPKQRIEQEVSGPGGGPQQTQVVIARDEALAIARRKGEE